jgi:hypothetical protein
MNETAIDFNQIIRRSVVLSRRVDGLLADKERLERELEAARAANRALRNG